MESEINDSVSFGPPSEIDSLKQRISELEAENVELKAKVVKLEDKQSQNELVKNLLSVPQKT